MSLIKEYFAHYVKFNKEYNNLIILMQVGSFYEMYDNPSLKNNDIFPLHIIADLLNITLTRKDKKKLDSPRMLGFPTVALYKFLRVLIENNYTVMIIDQEKILNKVTRDKFKIFTPGTFIDNISTDNNYILSIYIEEEKQLYNSDNIICIGLVLIDISIGSISFYEIISTKYDTKLAIDESVKFIHYYNPKEIIVFNQKNNNSKLEKEHIINLFELSNKTFQYYDHIEKVKLKISYQEELLMKVFNKSIIFLNLESYNYARISLILILDYIYKLNPKLITNIIIPEDYKNKIFLNLGNNSLYHLNIFSINSKEKSLYDILNNLNTALGRRFLKNELINPRISIKLLNNRYDEIDKLIQDNNYLKYDNELKNLVDIEKLHRKMALNIISPNEFFNLHNNYKIIINILKLNNNKLLNDFCNYVNYYNKIFKIQELELYQLNNITNNIFIKDINEQLEIDECKKEIGKIIEKVNNLFDTDKDEFSDKKVNNVRLEFSDRDFHYLVTTRKKSEIFKKNKVYKNFNIMHNKSNSKIFIKELTEISEKLILLENKMKSVMKDKFIESINKLFIKNEKLLIEICNFISYIDFIVNGAKIAIKYKYNKPQLIDNPKSFIKTKQLRHPIIERINQLSQYHPHNFSLGNDIFNGILLYGVNSAGKSSLMKSIGVNIILAQIGYYVAAKEFILSPYKDLFTRISNNDNIYKNQSSFTLEMTELQSIIKRSGKNTLVLADELASSTEVKSGNIIIMTMIEMLLKSETNFISATHFHEIYNYPRFKKLKDIKIFHIDINYDDKMKKIIYSRELKEGPGSMEYGLTIAKYIIQDNEFNKIATELQEEIYNDNLLSIKQSRYNNNVFMDSCTMCGYKPKYNETPLETHHIKEQHNFNENYNKNSKFNLMVLCQKCHDKFDIKPRIIYKMI